MTHEALRARLPAFRLGLLAEPASDEVAVHLASCTACAADLAALEESAHVEGSAGPDGGHLPASLLARWDHARDGLVGIEREMALRHLERCPDCRADLEIAGQTFRPVVAAPRVVSIESRRPSQRTFWLGAWGALATAALVFVLVRPPNTPAPVAVTPAPNPPPQTTITIAPVVLLPSTTRGTGEDLPPLEIEKGERIVAVAVPDRWLAGAGRDSVAITLRGPDGSVRAGANFGIPELRKNPAIAIHSSFEPGRYAIELGTSAGGKPEIRIRILLVR